jgi:hypothetical protein
MGVRDGVQLPLGVKGIFAQFLDDYLDPKHSGFTEWFWWNYLEDTLSSRQLKLVPIRVLGGLDKVQEAWDLNRDGMVSGQRLVITP